jgi:hypothetical protein
MLRLIIAQHACDKRDEELSTWNEEGRAELLEPVVLPRVLSFHRFIHHLASGDGENIRQRHRYTTITRLSHIHNWRRHYNIALPTNGM